MPDSKQTNRFSVPRGLSAYQRMWLRVDRSAGPAACWPWLTNSHHRYGYTLVGKREEAAHRLMWQFCIGPIPDGKHVLHRCDNTRCCNPKHLFLGTHLDNMRDKVAKGRQAKGERMSRVVRGEASGINKVVTADVIEIRRRFDEGESLGSISDDYPIGSSAVCLIGRRKRWSHVPESMK